MNAPIKESIDQSLEKPALPNFSKDIDSDNIPQELKDLDQWVNWFAQFELGKSKKWTKPPRQPQTSNKNSSCTNKNTWSSHDIALLWHEQNKNKVGVHEYKGVLKTVATYGIGIQFTKNDQYVGIDIDDCFIDGKPNKTAQEIINNCGSYTEISPSGKGLRIILKGVLPKGRKRKGHFEIYDHARYFTITGNRISDIAEIKEDQEAIDWYHSSFIGTQKKEIATTIIPSTNTPTLNNTLSSLCLSDNELLEKIKKSRQGHKFFSLFNGDISQHGDDWSSADMALMGQLAFWTNKNPSQMKAIFLQSALANREKSQAREDYLDTTIKEAIQNCSKTFNPNFKQIETQGKALFEIPSSYYLGIGGNNILKLTDKEWRRLDKDERIQYLESKYKLKKNALTVVDGGITYDRKTWNIIAVKGLVTEKTARQKRNELSAEEITRNRERIISGLNPETKELLDLYQLSIEQGNKCVVFESGTGTGKTYSSIIIALDCIQNGKKFIYVTTNKTTLESFIEDLQEQIKKLDLEGIELDFNASDYELSVENNSLYECKSPDEKKTGLEYAPFVFTHFSYLQRKGDTIEKRSLIQSLKGTRLLIIDEADKYLESLVFTQSLGQKFTTRNTKNGEYFELKSCPKSLSKIQQNKVEHLSCSKCIKKGFFRVGERFTGIKEVVNREFYHTEELLDNGSLKGYEEVNYKNLGYVSTKSFEDKGVTYSKIEKKKSFKDVVFDYMLMNPLDGIDELAIAFPDIKKEKLEQLHQLYFQPYFQKAEGQVVKENKVEKMLTEKMGSLVDVSTRVSSCYSKETGIAIDREKVIEIEDKYRSLKNESLNEDENFDKKIEQVELQPENEKSEQLELQPKAGKKNKEKDTKTKQQQKEIEEKAELERLELQYKDIVFPNSICETEQVVGRDSEILSDLFNSCQQVFFVSATYKDEQLEQLKSVVNELSFT
ncbi:MAG: putative DNA primase/helicase, partial [bacterium]